MTLKLRIMSDLHLEHQLMQPTDHFYPIEMPDDKETILILAGDVWEAGLHLTHQISAMSLWEGAIDAEPGSILAAVEREMRGTENIFTWMQIVSRQFRAVVMVNGNHEHWFSKNTVDRHQTEMSQNILFQGLDNVHLLENSWVEFDDVMIVGATMWTDLDREHPMLMMRKHSGMGGDCKRITGFSPELEVQLHKESLRVIAEVIDNDGAFFRKRVVVTHHGPTWKSVHPRYAGDIANGMFCSQVDIEELFPTADLWVHGHVHDPFDYTVGNTRVVCNPCGLPWENHGFNPNLLIEV